MDWISDLSNNFYGIGVFGFIILIVLINSIASVIKSGHRSSIIKEALRSGKDIDPALMESFADEDSAEKSGGMVTGGGVLIAVALALILLGFVGSDYIDEPNAKMGMAAVAAFPGFIGIVLVISGLANKNK